MSFKQYQLVVFDVRWRGDLADIKYPFNNGEIVLFLGEVVQMPGHCVVANNAGYVIFGHHTEDFREPTSDEI